MLSQHVRHLIDHLARLLVFSTLLIFLISLLVAAPTPIAHAAGIRYATPIATGTGNCLSWANACTLQTALTGAVSSDEIWVAAGTHKPSTTGDRGATFQLIAGVAVYGGFTGTETARDQRNPATHVTVLSGDVDNDDSQTPIITDLTTVTGNTTNSYHVVTGANNATLDGFTITAGYANRTNPNDSGGGMINLYSSPTLTNLIFSGNVADTAGGGLATSTGSPTLTNITFSANLVTWYGGGMFNDTGSPALTNVTFSGNSSQFGPGGGMYNNPGGNPTLTNVTFSGNSAPNNGGGGMFVYGSSPTLTNVTFSGNSAGVGGGLYQYQGGNPQIRNTIFWGNMAAGGGAQIYNDGFGSPSVSDSVVQGGFTGTNIITADPLLGALGNYGGSTQTIPLLAGSSAINTGNDTICPATDQRGMTRPQGAYCDIGAFEYKSIYYVKPVASGTGDCRSWTNACILQTALTSAISGEEIWVAAGTHKPTTLGTDRSATFQLKNGVALYGGFAGTETAREQRDPAINITILSGDIDNDDSQKPIITDLTTVNGNTTNSYHVVIGATGATLDGFTITAGYASGSITANYGGGIYNAASDPVVADVKFSGNWAGYGGGMFNDFGSKPMLTDVIFNHNSATNQGGGLFSQGASSPALVNVTFTGNSSNQGGGMFNHNGSNATLEDVTFNSNTADWGGGMYNQVSSTPTLTNVTFSGNSATNYGGGMSNNSSSNLQIRNTVFWSNTAPSGGAQIYNTNSTPSVSDSVVQGGCPAGSTCTNILTTDPKLGTLGNYGGSTQTIPLLPGSSAINATSTNCPATDQRGIARGTTCDMGAFESQGFTLTKTSGDNQSTVINTAFTNPLGLNVTSAYGEPVNGGQVILTAPASGASITTTLITMTIAGGAVSQSVTANSTTGTYSVTASTSGASSTIFSLTNNNPVATLATLNPASAKAGGVGFTLVVTGTNFITGSTIRWNGSDRVTTFVSSSQLTATIPAGDIATIGTANVDVFNPTPGGGTSNSLVFTIGQATTNLVLTSSPNPSIVGNTVTFTATLTQNNTLARPNSRAPSDVTPTGTVTFTLDATTNVTRTMNASGVTTYTTSSLAVGAHTIVATYSGDANLVGAISNTVTQNVKAKLFLPLILR